MSLRWQRAATAFAIAVTLLGCTETGPVARSTTSIETIPSTTVPIFDMTDFSMDQVANAPPLDWTLVISDDSLQPAGLVNVGGTSFVFAEDTSGHGLWGWSSVDGSSWADLGEILPDDTAVAVVTSSEDSIFFATEGRADQNPQIWRSTDGLDWTVEEIPTGPDEKSLAFIPGAFLATSDVLIVTGSRIVDTQHLVEQAVRDSLWPGFDAKRDAVVVRPTSDAVEIDVLGPSHLTLLTTTADVLGLDPSVQELLRSEPESAGATTWVSYKGNWESGTIEGAETVSSLAITQLGDVVAVGWTQLGLVSLWNSFDGVVWEQVPYDVRPYLFENWDDLLIGPSAIGDFDLLVSDDGIDWTETGLGRSFPRALVWHVTSASTSDLGLFATVEAFQDGVNQDVAPFPTPIEKEGLSIFVDPFSGSLLVFDESGANPHVWESGVRDDGFVFESETETIHLFKPDGSGLVDLTLDELEEAAQAFTRDVVTHDPYHRGLISTDDAESWSIWDLAQLGEVAEPDDVGVVGSTVVVATRDHARGTGFELWAAQLP